MQKQTNKCYSSTEIIKKYIVSMDAIILEILKDLVKCRSLTPNDDGAIDYISGFLGSLGFLCQKFQFGETTNLYAKFGTSQKNLCFAGHVDVVPPLDGWKSDPFELTEKDGKLFGRGVNDMKGPLASCLSAIHCFLSEKEPDFSISVLLTSDEEIMAEDGMASAVQHLKGSQEHITACVLCESCSPKESGEYIKNGCRGSLNVNLTSKGTQCHVVNTAKYGNHIHGFIETLSKLTSLKLDNGNKNFAPSNLEITSIDIGNDVRNIVPVQASAKMNIRFNTEWTFEKLEQFITDQLSSNIDVSFERFGYPFIGASEKFIKFLKTSIEKTIGKIPEIGTLGGNSDAVSIREITDVVEIGAPVANAHITNEFIEIKDLEKLKAIYHGLIRDFEVL